MLCTPAVVYLVVALIALVINFVNYSPLSVLLHIIFIGFWTTILNWICSKNMTWLSWVLVLLPFVLFGLFLLLVIESIALDTMNIFGTYSGKYATYAPTI